MIPILNQKEASQIMALTQQETRHALKEITQISKQLVHKMAEYHLLSQDILHRIDQNENQAHPQAYYILYQDHLDQLKQLQVEIKSLLHQKVAISESLYLNNANRYQVFESLIQEDQYLQSKQAKLVLKDYLSTEQTVNLIHDYQAKEIACMCLCNGEVTSDDMIKCDNSKCKARWYHLTCVGVQKSSIPEGTWQCHNCLE